MRPLVAHANGAHTLLKQQKLAPIVEAISSQREAALKTKVLLIDSKVHQGKACAMATLGELLSVQNH